MVSAPSEAPILYIAQCLKYYTDQQSDVRRVEQLNGLFFRLMAAGPDAPGASLLCATLVHALQSLMSTRRSSRAHSVDPACTCCCAGGIPTGVFLAAIKWNLSPVYRTESSDEGSTWRGGLLCILAPCVLDAHREALCFAAEDVEMAPAASDAQQPQAQQAHNHQQQRPAQQRQRHQQQGGKGGGGGKKRRG